MGNTQNPFLAVGRQFIDFYLTLDRHEKPSGLLPFVENDLTLAVLFPQGDGKQSVQLLFGNPDKKRARSNGLADIPNIHSFSPHRNNVR
jgi:hypothetical protein